MRYKVNVILFGVLLAVCTACAARPSKSYYDSLYVLAFKLQISLSQVGYKAAAIDPALIKQTDDFLQNNRAYRRLGSYYLLSIINRRLHGETMPGDLGIDGEQERDLKEYLATLTTGSVEDTPQIRRLYGGEAERMGVEVDLVSLRKQAQQELTVKK